MPYQYPSGYVTETIYRLRAASLALASRNAFRSAGDPSKSSPEGNGSPVRTRTVLAAFWLASGFALGRFFTPEWSPIHGRSSRVEFP